MFIGETEEQAGAYAADRASRILRDALHRKGQARAVFASAPSQQAMLAHLSTDTRIDWSRVSSFHMDEYLGLQPQHPAAFGTWLRRRLPGAALEHFETIRTDGDPDAEASRYSALLAAGPIDLVCLGIGVNGHIAFNEPDQAQFDDPLIVRKIALDETSRRQQVDEGLFPSIDDVPTHALTLTVPALLRGGSLVCTVVGAQKAAAVAAALEGPIGTHVPATALRRHLSVRWALDRASASQLSAPPQPGMVTP